MYAYALFIIVVIGFAWMAGKLLSSLRQMEVRMGVGVVLAKRDNPMLFWSVVSIQSLGVGILLAIICFVIFVLPNKIMT
ncbi:MULTISPECIES: hypothetical protein [unclassified Bradyrhizobium]